METEQVLLEEVQEEAEVWVEVAVGEAEWAEIVPEQALGGNVFVQAVVRKHLIR